MTTSDIFQVYIWDGSLRLSSKCEDHFFKSSLDYTSQNISFTAKENISSKFLQEFRLVPRHEILTCFCLFSFQRLGTRSKTIRSLLWPCSRRNRHLHRSTIIRFPYVRTGHELKTMTLRRKGSSSLSLPIFPTSKQYLFFYTPNSTLC